MSRDQLQSAQDDIAYMKALAHEGRQSPLLGGAVLATAGAVFSLAAVIHFMIDIGVIDLPPIAFSILWGIAMVILGLVLTRENRRLCRRPGAHSPLNRAVGAGWMGVGLAVFVLAVSMAVIGWKTQSAIAFMIFPSLIFALYGSAWAVSATMTGSRLQWNLAIGGWVAAPLIAFLVGSPFLWLGYAAGLLLLALAPGLILLRQEPSEVI